MSNKTIEIIGWYGATAILAAYGLISFSILTANSIWYHLLSGSGALGIVIVAFHKRDYQSGTLNILYALIALITLFRILI